MKIKIFLLVGLISLLGFVNCFGPFKKEEKNKEAENLLLLEVASTEELEINGTWEYKEQNITVTSKFSAQKSLLGGTKGNLNVKYVFNNQPQESESFIVDFNNQTKTLFVKVLGEFQSDCNGNDVTGEEGVECYVRYVWTISNDYLYICPTSTNKGSLEEAKNDPTTADPNNLTSGCPGLLFWINYGSRQ